MALAVTRLGTATFDTNSGTKTVTATPAVGDLIIIITAHSGNTSAATPTDNNSSGTYTKITSATGQSSADTLSVFVRNSLIGAANSTVFSHAPGTSTGGGLAVIKVTGMSRSGASAILQSAIQNNQASGGTPAPVFGSAAQTTNAVISAVMNVTNPAGVSVRSSPLYTARVSAGYTVPTTGLGAMSIDSGETGTSIAWGSASASAFCSLAIEVDATSLPTGIGSSSGASTVTGVGKAQDKGSGSSTGSATASGVGKARDKGSGSSTGTGTASGVGKAKDKGAGASAGTGTASAVGKVLVKSAGSSSGAATATATGKSTANGVGSSAGAATPAGVGKALNLTVGSSDGSSTVTGVGRGGVIATGTSSGSSTATGTGKTYATGVGLSDGFGVAVGEGSSIALAVGTAVGVATVSGIGSGGAIIALPARRTTHSSAMPGTASSRRITTYSSAKTGTGE